MKRIISLLLLACFFTLCLTSCGAMREAKKGRQYENALALIKDGEYEQAYALLKEIGDYEDAKKYLSHFRYLPIEVTWEQRDTSESASFSYNDRDLLARLTTTSILGHTDTSEYAYDERGNLSKMDGPSYPDYGENKCTYTNTYDEKGRLSQTVKTVSGKNVATTLYTYDGQGNLTEERTAYHLSGLTYVRTYAYDTAGRLTRYAYSYCDISEADVVYIYDEKGNLIKETKTDKYGELYTYEYTYDETGNLTKKFCRFYDYTNETYEYAYDKEGKVTKRIYTNPYHDTVTYTYTYDKKNGLVKESFTDGEGYTETATITYTLVYLPRGLPAFFEEMLDMLDVWWYSTKEDGIPPLHMSLF